MITNLKLKAQTMIAKIYLGAFIACEFNGDILSWEGKVIYPQKGNILILAYINKIHRHWHAYTKKVCGKILHCIHSSLGKEGGLTN